MCSSTACPHCVQSPGSASSMPLIRKISSGHLANALGARSESVKVARKRSKPGLHPAPSGTVRGGARQTHQHRDRAGPGLAALVPGSDSRQGPCPPGTRRFFRSVFFSDRWSRGSRFAGRRFTAGGRPYADGCWCPTGSCRTKCHGIRTILLSSSPGPSPILYCPLELRPVARTWFQD